MQRDVRAIKHKEKLGFVLMDSFESLIECCKACFSGKDRVETQLELNLLRLTAHIPHPVAEGKGILASPLAPELTRPWVAR